MSKPRIWISLVVALLLLDISLSFRNIWPTPAIRWKGELSIELAVCLLILIAIRVWRGRLARGLVSGLAALWVLLVLGHYADVTAPALYGREVNLYWDARNLSAVAEMLGSAASRWLVVGVLLASALILWLLYAGARWAFGRVSEALDRPEQRRLIGGLSIAAIALLAIMGYQSTDLQAPGFLRFPAPVTKTYAHQVQLVMKARAAATSNVLPPSPEMRSNFSRVSGADVFVFFIESYGAVSFERPEFAARLASARTDFDAAIRETHRDVVSAYVESPTFGGNSWLAHITLLSGVEVRDRDTNALLMTQKRDTLVTAFARGGYRTVAVMPGMWQSWPEGVFYGFNQIYNGSQLDYWGPQFGWWDIPDQYALAKMDALEESRPSRPPLFIFMPTVTTHIPFSPVPPYQPDWQRVLTRNPFDEKDVEHVFDVSPDWLNLGPGYVSALQYVYTSLSGYLRLRGDKDFVMILLGDHQPPAAVTGQGAPWDVPVHVIASRPGLLEALRTRGFKDGLTPDRPSLGHMQELVPILLGAFGS